MFTFRRQQQINDLLNCFIDKLEPTIQIFRWDKLVIAAQDWTGHVMSSMNQRTSFPIRNQYCFSKALEFLIELHLLISLRASDCATMYFDKTRFN